MLIDLQPLFGDVPHQRAGSLHMAVHFGVICNLIKINKVPCTAAYTLTEIAGVLGDNIHSSCTQQLLSSLVVALALKG